MQGGYANTVQAYPKEYIEAFDYIEKRIEMLPNMIENEEQFNEYRETKNCFNSVYPPPECGYNWKEVYAKYLTK